MVLVTGASGFLGSHLVRHLSAQGMPVRALYRDHQPPAELKNLPGTEWQRRNLLDVYDVEEAMKGIIDIYHCAAIVSFDPRKREEMLHANPECAANIVNQAITQGIHKMVYVSSIASLGRAEGTKEISEEVEWGESRYNSAYAISKYLAEMEVWRGIGEGLNAVIVNPGIILGADHYNDLSAQLMKVVYREFPFYSRGVNAWVDVIDVAKAMVMLMESEVEAERYILSAGNFSYREIFTLMADALGKKPPRYYANPFMTGIAWRLSRLGTMLFGLRSIITRETVNNSNSMCYYNNEKLLHQFPAFSYTPVNQTIIGMARSFLKK